MATGNARGQRLFAILLGAGFVLSVAMIAGVALLVLNKLRVTAERREAIVGLAADDLARAERIRAASDQMAVALRGYLLIGDPGLLADLRTAEGRLERALLPAGAPELGIAAAFEGYRSAVNRVVSAGIAGRDPAAATRLFESEVLPARQVLDLRMDALVAEEDRQLQDQLGDARQEVARAIAWGATALGLGVLASLALAWVTTHRLSRAFSREAEAAERARRALEARDELLGVVAHDLRGPLHAIVLAAGVLRREAGADHRALHRGEAIGRIAGRMERMLGSLLDAARIEAGTFTVEKRTCRAEDVVREAVETYAGLAEEQEVRLEQVVDPDLELLADRERLLQVLHNLLGNALKFTPPGGRVTLVAERQGEGARLAVADTGGGIAPEDLPRVFDRYWRGSSRRAAGTGLGLFIARGVVASHGGDIRVDSRAGRGTTFTFTLPGAPRP